uniref:Cupin_6 domain-containing protein n=1 Tax=Syphacia muris TaxID=451379 RepID=A0A0N5A9R9_9BILA
MMLSVNIKLRSLIELSMDRSSVPQSLYRYSRDVLLGGSSAPFAKREVLLSTLLLEEQWGLVPFTGFRETHYQKRAVCLCECGDVLLEESSTPDHEAVDVPLGREWYALRGI